MKPLKNVLETAKELGARKFAKLIEQSGVRNQFVREGAITLFAPHDDAMKVLYVDNFFYKRLSIA